MTTVLIADDDQDLRQVFRLAVETQGFRAVEATNANEAIDIFDEQQPGIVISDYMMPGGDGLELLRAVRQRSANAIVIMMTGCGKEEVAVEALRLRANNYLVKPVRMDEFMSLLDKYGRILRERTVEEEILGMILSREFTIQFDNRIDIVSKIADQLLREAGNRIDSYDRNSIHLGLYEMLINAIEHGNLGITFEEKARALENSNKPLQQLYEERLADPRYRDRKVTVEFRMDREQCEWIIEDEGDGFDHKHLPTELKEGVSESLNGRGIFLTRFQFDELEYLGKGNRVRLVKYLPDLSMPNSLDEVGIDEKVLE